MILTHRSRLDGGGEADIGDAPRVSTYEFARCEPPRSGRWNVRTAQPSSGLRATGRYSVEPIPRRVALRARSQ
jgi:hypothetical protein